MSLTKKKTEIRVARITIPIRSFPVNPLCDVFSSAIA